MSEISMYDAYKKKLQNICDENNLVYRFRRDTYPITLTIKPCGGMDAQMTMLEMAEEDGYISPDASIVFVYKDGVIQYKTSEQFTISDALFSKIKNLFKNLHYCWLQYFFRNIIERNILSKGAMPAIDESDACDDDFPEEAEALEEFEDCEDEDETDDSDDTEDSEDSESDDTMDEMLSDAIKLVRAENKASVSLLQRRLNIGYAKAAWLMDALEDAGVVGPFNGSNPREVLPCDEPDDDEVTGNE